MWGRGVGGLGQGGGVGGGYLTHEERLSGKKAGDFCFVNRNWFGFSGVYLLLFLK